MSKKHARPLMLPGGGDNELEAVVTAVTGELTAMNVERRVCVFSLSAR
jgi:hypothetical protein